MKNSIIGIGRLGGALAIALAGSGFEVENLAARKGENAAKIAGVIEPKPKILSPDELGKITSDIIFITTQDSEIQNVAANLVQNLSTRPIVFHTSGALSSEILQSLKESGCRVGSFHPLVSVSDPVLGAERFKSAYFCVEGDREAVIIAEQIVERLGGKAFSIETKYKTLYHASAVTACGHLVALIDVAVEMLSKCGLNTEKAQEVLLPLIRSTVENLSRQKTAAALTGTFARADIETMEKHLKVLSRNVSAEALEVYLQLGNRSVHLAEVQGGNVEKLKEMRKKISLAKTKLK